ncbi:Yip1 family protein [Fusibacter ferrireducens]|uniref:YIP1 family protein n=1 Tax=Fusibacter ferrireducens TaxID=2785058 RepID=A0ABR9ZRV5_9FIRM|nr:Yip1 family protein [Fusibacter ferrireducens]MBF4693188.1 YIP1 family protein [Fusibacter ferrireducens]
MSEFNDRQTEELILEEQSNIRPKMGHLQRVIGIFTKPQEVIEDINRSPKLLVPMLLVAIVTALVTFTSYDTLLETTRMAMVNAARTQGQDIPLDGFAGLSQTMATASVALSGVGIIVVSLVSALILHGVSTFMNGEGSIKKIWSASLYIYFIPLLGSLIAGLVSMVLNLDFLTFSPAILLSSDQLGKPLYSLLATFDVFNIWRIGVMILAVKTIEVFSTKRASIVVISITVLGVLFQIVPNLGK